MRVMASLLARGVSPEGSAVRSSWRVKTLPMPCHPPRVMLRSCWLWGGVLVVGIETGEERVKVLALRRRKFIHCRRDDHIRGAVPISIGVVTGVIARTLGLVFVPFLGHGNPGNHDVLNAVVRHGLEQLVHAGALLKEIHVMQVRVAVGIVTSLRGKAADGKQQGKTQAGSRHGKTSIWADTGRPCASLQGSAWKKPEHWSASMLYNCMTFI